MRFSCLSTSLVLIYFGTTVASMQEVKPLNKVIDDKVGELHEEQTKIDPRQLLKGVGERGNKAAWWHLRDSQAARDQQSQKKRVSLRGSLLPPPTPQQDKDKGQDKKMMEEQQEELRSQQQIKNLRQSKEQDALSGRTSRASLLNPIKTSSNTTTTNSITTPSVHRNLLESDSLPPTLSSLEETSGIKEVSCFRKADTTSPGRGECLDTMAADDEQYDGDDEAEEDFLDDEADYHDFEAHVYDFQPMSAQGNDYDVDEVYDYGVYEEGW